MNRIRRIRRMTAAIAGLAATWLGLAAAAPAAFAEQASPPGASGPVIVTRTVIVGGMPGWQIALIAVGAALVAAALAVLADRGLDRPPHRHPGSRVKSVRDWLASGSVVNGALSRRGRG